jgi:hypothetical protein
MAWLLRQGYSSATRALSLPMLRVFFDACHRHGWLPELASNATTYVEKLYGQAGAANRRARAHRRPGANGIATSSELAPVWRRHGPKRPAMAPLLLYLPRPLWASQRPTDAVFCAVKDQETRLKYSRAIPSMPTKAR